MVTITATEARKSFFELIKQTNQTHDVIQVQHKSGNAVIMSAEDYESLQEALFLLSQPGFSEGFEQSLEDAKAGDGASFDQIFGESL